MYIFNNFILKYIILVIIIFMIILIPKKLKTKLMLSISLILIIALNFVIVTISSRPSYDQVTNIDLIEEDRLSIELKDSKLIHSNSKIPVKYLVFEKENKNFSFSPIYLNDFEDYYFVIFSTDKTKKITNNLFRVLRTYNYNMSDFAVFIDKKTGEVIDIQKHDLYGNFIILDSIYFVNNSFSFKLIHKDYPNIDVLITGDIAHKNNYLYISIEFFDYGGIIKSAFDDNYVSLVVDSSGRIIFKQKIYETENGNVTKTTEKHYKYLANEEYVKQGYFETINKKIYYVDNNMNICIINGNSSSVVMKIDSLENWTMHIK
ncbi:hypothetical protein [Haploplasma axanthum]|uniref:Uncharacterized protein n=1 Tax=Haploplasma axanthum TaxID=29552 RepID=A0A449BDM0_HAPAX|nr:hypothetical protein [Haploplasma axanthum]VEU80553.1 Uncharacterised protein [Haploplasma axanthum]